MESFYGIDVIKKAYPIFLQLSSFFYLRGEGFFNINIIGAFL
jgi:hypothetical protein